MILALFFLFCVGTGCSRVRTYTVEKERVDQDLSQGNQGYLMGTPKEGEVPQQRKTARATYVTEIELGAPYKAKKPSGQAVPQPAQGLPAVPQAVSQETASAPTATVSVPTVTSYTVERNDTLQGISLKVYGTSKKWKQIFEANKDQLKSPDRIYAGQILKIPQD